MPAPLRRLAPVLGAALLAAAADVGVAYGHGGVGLLFRDGKIVRRMKAEELEDAVVEEALRIAAGRAPG